MATRVIKVWDIAVRTFHWSLVLFFFISYISADDGSIVHVYSGYAVLGLIVFRILWGLIGTKYARFTNFIYGPKKTRAYLVSLIKLKPKHYIGHNPLGGWMMVLLLIFLLLTVWSGLEMYGAEGKGPLARNDIAVISTAMADDDNRDHDKNRNGDKDELWEEAHEFLGNFTLLLVFVHVLGVLISSAIHRENLIQAMITGEKKVSSE